MGISESDIASRTLHVYPNPATDHLYISIPDEFSGADLRADLFDASGRLARQQIIRDGYMDVSTVPGGIYFLKLYSPGKVFHAKVLINK